MLLRLLALSTLLAGALAAQDADLIITNARVWTGVESSPWAEAVVVRGDRILAAGTSDVVTRHRASHTRIIDAAGRLVTPGFIDNHTHFGQAGALLLGANLLDVADANMLVQRVREARDRLPAGAWIVGGDWGAYEDWQRGSAGAAAGRSQQRFRPTRTLIDSITPETPVLLSRWDRSEYLANAAALSKATLSCTSPIAGLECERGQPTGRVSDEALRRVRAAIPPKSLEQRLREARVALQQLREFGVTGIHDNTPPEQLRVYQVLKQRGELTTRIYARPTLDKWDELAAVGITHGFGDEMLKIGGLKGFVDGIMGNSTARFYEPQLHSGKRGEWRDSTNTAATSGSGSGMMPPGNLERLIIGADAAGHWPQVHAIGDEAIDTLLTLYEKAIQTNGPRERRLRIIHSQVLRDSSVAGRFARNAIIAEVQPYHAIDDMRWMEERIGKRARWAYAFRTLADAGVLLSFGSDWPGTNASWYPSDPLKGIYAAVTRQTLDGNPPGGWFPEERVDVETALRAYTVNTAWAAGEESIKGSIAPGKLADLVVLDRDLFTIPPRELKEAKVLVTILGGRVLYDATTTSRRD
ncbi:MAG TPA: amidohydrolase [Gemmatimonadaceae bacterium]|nr:amidohydrolase [Gemmatimonadaceae bacterium]